MPGVVSRNAVLVSQNVDRHEAAFRECCFLWRAAEQTE